MRILDSRRLHGSKTFDWPATSATQGAEQTTTVNVAGAVVGDAVIATHSTLTTQAAILQAYVSAAGVVTVRLINTTAAAVDLASGTLRVAVLRDV